MIKSILVPATGQASDAVVWSAALALAQTFSALLAVLHIRVDPVEVATMMSSDGAGGTLLQGVIDSLARAADETEAKARAAFTDFCEREKLPVRAAAAAGMEGPSAELHVKATFERLSTGPSGAAETLLAAATKRADLLVMGGYGRSRLREWVFGGFTDTVLTDSPLPVLMAH